MANPPVSGHNTASDHLQTWILRVYIHCEGCKKKVYKVLQSVDGVYKTVIEAKEHKVTVTGYVNGETLVQKLLKSGKRAEILPESFGGTVAADNGSGNPKKKKKQSIKQNDDGVTKAVDDEDVIDGNNKSKGATTGGNVQEVAEVAPAVAGDGGGGKENGGSGGAKKKKKKKKTEGDKNTPPDGVSNGLPTGNPAAETGVTAEDVGASMEEINLGTPIIPQAVYSYDLPPYHNYYTPAYGVSYSTSQPSAESSYYTPPGYGYSQLHPSVLYPVPSRPSNYRRSAFDDYDDESGEGRWCSIM